LFGGIRSSSTDTYYRKDQIGRAQGGGAAAACGLPLAQTRVASYTAIDLYGEYRFRKNWKFSMTVVNVADRDPPYDSANLRFGVIGTPYDLFTYDDFGRMIDLHVSYSF
jgi:outer membrane receptor protein involved in Fe transport